MKKIILTLSIIAMIACQAQEKQFSEQALKEKLISLEGNEANLGSIIKRHEGKTVLIDIWASWCGDCVKAMPLIKGAQTDYPNVDYVFISMDKTADKWKAGIGKHELKGEHYWATDGMKGLFGTAIDLDWIPRYIVIDKKGKVTLYRATEKEFDQVKAILNKKAKK